MSNKFLTKLFDDTFPISYTVPYGSSVYLEKVVFTVCDSQIN